MPDEQQQQTIPVGSAEGLQRFYMLHGQQAHQLAEAQIQIEVRNAKLRELMERYGPKPEAPAEGGGEDGS